MRQAFLAVIMALSVTIAAFAWAASGLSGLLSFTGEVLELCRSLFVMCVEYKDALKLAFLWSGALLVFGGVVYGAVKSGGNFFRARQKIKALSVYDNKGSVVMIKDAGARLAFTYGFLRPKIYISSALIASLDRKELLSVFFHELRHKRAKDPLRFFLIGFFKDCFFYIPLLRIIYANLRANAEISADDFAASFLKEPLSLASALLKVASGNKRLIMEAAFIAGGDEAGVVERVQRLSHGIEPKPKNAGLRTVFLSLSVAIALILSFAWPVAAGFHGKDSVVCAMKRCESHASSLDKDCKTHCETKHNHHAH